MTGRLLTVVMPVHGGERWLGAALDSLPVRDPRLAVVIRDSTPAGPCADLVASYADRLSIDYAWWPDVPSWTRKTNLGVAAASTDHVCTLHQDDLWLAGRMEAFLRDLDTAPGAHLFLSASRIVDACGRQLGTWSIPVAPGRVEGQALHDALLVQNTVAMPAPVFRRDAYLAVGGMDEALWYTPDWDLWLKLAARGPGFYDPVPRTGFRIHGASQTMTGNRSDLEAQLAAVLDRHLPQESPLDAICRASVRVNILLARAAAGNPLDVLRGFAEIARLGPVAALRYLHLSRLAQRVVPRVRARLSGAL
ncbi:hypothetical protein N0B51_02340 [Tsuneonella sp. YG55]|uniref:Glycosyltransferase 2-like prokaryotic type domain-containing protein n=1 Tax=Tsuneonella litorea TaxID=2976475 RepID=A0A9X2W0A2_9SPHN|nr:hypothetical protein [Tsuneonella litorea]MCT2557814.1 hypothetical protein [Tsuneonella litorea]